MTFVEQLGRIVDYVDQLVRFETAEPDLASSAATPEAEDRPRGSLPRERFLENAPESWEGFLVVPQVVPGREEGEG